MPKTLKAREIMRLIKKDGWVQVNQKGSHRQFKHPVKPGRVTISAHKISDDIHPDTVKSILKQAGLD